MPCVLNLWIRPRGAVLLVGVLLPAAPVWAQAPGRATWSAAFPGSVFCADAVCAKIASTNTQNRNISLQ